MTVHQGLPFTPYVFVMVIVKVLKGAGWMKRSFTTPPMLWKWKTREENENRSVMYEVELRML